MVGKVYKEGNNRPSSVNQLSLVHNHDKAGNKCYTQDNTNTQTHSGNPSVLIGDREEYTSPVEDRGMCWTYSWYFDQNFMYGNVVWLPKSDRFYNLETRQRSMPLYFVVLLIYIIAALFLLFPLLCFRSCCLVVSKALSYSYGVNGCKFLLVLVGLWLSELHCF